MASQDHGIHSFKECVPEGSDYFEKTLGKEHIRRTSTHNKRKEDGSNWRSRFHDSKKIPQAMRNIKNSILEEPLIHIENLDKKWWCHEWRRWWSRRLLRRSILTKQIDISISWYCFVMHFFIFSWCIMHDRMFALMRIYY